MNDYHHIWLSNHPSRSKEWLQERLRDGFDIHHADGDHSNNDPSNLVLIECDDHMRLHGLSISRLLQEGREGRAQKRIDEKTKHEALGRQCYEKKDASVSWAAIGRELFPKSLQPAAWARTMAKRHAERNNKPFPKPGANMSLQTSRGHFLEPHS